ncbi:unnamed protein product, partial [Rotaria magnacalcarata]
NYRSNESTKYTLCANTDFIAENQTKQSQSSAESLLDDPPLFIDMKSVKRPTFDTITNKRQIPRNGSRYLSKNSTAATRTTRKRRVSPEAASSSRSKRTRTTKKSFVG